MIEKRRSLKLTGNNGRNSEVTSHASKTPVKTPLKVGRESIRDSSSVASVDVEPKPDPQVVVTEAGMLTAEEVQIDPQVIFNVQSNPTIQQENEEPKSPAFRNKKLLNANDTLKHSY